jgi:hypothetical protein
MAIWRPFFLILSVPNSYYCHQQGVQIKKKIAKLPLLSAKGCHTSLDGQHYPTYHGDFLRVGKPSEDITSRLFLMTKKGLRKIYHFANFET